MVTNWFLYMMVYNNVHMLFEIFVLGHTKMYKTTSTCWFNIASYLLVVFHVVAFEHCQLLPSMIEIIVFEIMVEQNMPQWRMITPGFENIWDCSDYVNQHCFMWDWHQRDTDGGTFVGSIVQCQSICKYK